MSKEKKLIGTTIITAIAASLCCITPILALVAGTSGIASTFSWIAPFRPFLITLTILVLLVAWYQKLKPLKKEIDCNCEDEKVSFINSKKFLVVVTLFAAVMLAFPSYSQLFYPNTSKKVVHVKESNSSEIKYTIKGMTCASCELHIENEVNKLEGVLKVKANYEKGNTIVNFDKTKVTQKDIKNAVLKTGYKIIE